MLECDKLYGNMVELSKGDHERTVCVFGGA